jgi:asparagine synthase (glutamine-hydrolysing)
MCGVVAIFHHDHLFDISKNTVEKMNKSQTHRGPDGNGYYIANGIALAHTRLAIIDLEGGEQPLFDQTNTVGITYNGEIYNYKELRSELINLGYKFNTNSDTEVIVNAWLEWHTLCVEKLNGMFAFVLFDKNKKQMFAARDRLGIKPLHWAKTTDNQIIFSSEIKAIKEHKEIALTINLKSIEDYLSLGYILEPKSIYVEVNKLLPGHYILLDQNYPEKFVNNPYWDLKEHLNQNEKAYNIEEVHAQLSQVVQDRMMADVPLGAFLSGGIDSSAIVAFMSQLSAAPIITSSIGFDMSKFDESFFAEKVAKHFKTKHSTTNVSVNDLSLVDIVVDTFDEPFADNSAIPTLILCKVTREKVKVALSGDGSDELFFGYRNYQMLNFEEKLRSIFLNRFTKPVFHLMAKYYPKFDNIPRFLRAKSTFKALTSDHVTSFYNAMSLSDSSTLDKLYSYQFKQKLEGYSALNEFKALANEVSHLSPMKQVQYIDFKTYLPGDILTKVDRASMANSLEVRVPFLDYKLVEWGLGLNEKLNLKGQKVKQVLASTVKGLVPDFVLERKKMGFTSPLDEWIRQIPQAALEKRILTKALVSLNIFNINELKAIIEAHQNRTLNNGVLIWALLVLASFIKKEKK